MLNPKVEAALNAQINAELWSAYLYLSMAAYAHANGNPGMGNWFEVQFQEEQDQLLQMVLHERFFYPWGVSGYDTPETAMPKGSLEVFVTSSLKSNLTS